MSDVRDHEDGTLVPVEQETVSFYGHRIVAVRLTDGRIGVVLHWLCESLHLAIDPQVRRIRRKRALAGELLRVRVATEGGPQSMQALALRVLPIWLAGIDDSRIADAATRETIVRFQQEATDVLYRHFAEKPPALTPPPNLVPAEPVVRPERPGRDASPEEWLSFHEQMAAWYRWQADVEAWRQGVGQWQGEIESRLESVEEVSRLVPEILERLGPQTLSPEHQHAVQAGVKRLHELTGKPYAAIYDDLRQAFLVSKYSDIAETRWPEVAAWFKQRIERASTPNR